MTAPVWFHLLAGPNGAGKSTLYRALVREGGHPVPPERVLARYPRTMTNLAQAVRLADVAYLYDAIDEAESGPRLVAIRTPAATTALTDALPRWVQRMLGDAAVI